ncbi:MAG: aspartate kinase [Marinilabiliales bacterium]|nr:MAG: aspartate kinase [Marinilabiliales bacterium]
MTRVFKFGGALMQNAEGIMKVGDIIEEYSCEPLVIVVSALGKTTNALENLLSIYLEDKNSNESQEVYFKLKQYHLKILNKLCPNSEENAKLDKLFSELWEALNTDYKDHYFAYDQIVSFGERFSSFIVTNYLMQRGINVKGIDSTEIIVTDSNFTDATVDWKTTNKTIDAKVATSLSLGYTVVIQGFIAFDHKGMYTTLGREGSDFTAAIVANILNAKEVTIWKDVPGLMNADPKRFEDTFQLKKISYHEAIELAFYGASIIHPKTIQPLKEKGIPLYVRSFYNPQNKPSLISSDSSSDEKEHKIILKDNQVLLSITSKNLDFITEENLTLIFKALSQHKIHVNMMQNSAVSFSISFNYHENKFNALLKELDDKFKIRYNIGLQLLTIRHYSDEILNKQLQGKNIFLEQKSRSTVQLLIR